MLSNNYFNEGFYEAYGFYKIPSNNDIMHSYKKKDDSDKLLGLDNTNSVYGESTNLVSLEDIFSDYLVDKALSRQTPIYISDDAGDPSIEVNQNSKFIAAIPIIQEKETVGVLIIEKMPFILSGLNQSIKL